jgi:hypothetical protein
MPFVKSSKAMQGMTTGAEPGQVVMIHSATSEPGAAYSPSTSSSAGICYGRESHQAGAACLALPVVTNRNFAMRPSFRPMYSSTSIGLRRSVARGVPDSGLDTRGLGESEPVAAPAGGVDDITERDRLERGPQGVFTLQTLSATPDKPAPAEWQPQEASLRDSWPAQPDSPAKISQLVRAIRLIALENLSF